MLDPIVVFVGLTFLLAGFVKGVIGLGLPTISMGLLAVAMPPARAAALLIVPSLVTNVWQMLAGPGLMAALRRLWTMMAGVMAGTWAGAGLISGGSALLAATALGIALVVYAILGLTTLRWSVQTTSERWLSPIIGAATGLITAATGVFVIPAVPYLQALGFDKEEFVQALGLSFTVSTLALAGNLIQVRALDSTIAVTSLLALLPALAGMYLGQLARSRLQEDTFRRVFFWSLLVLGGYLALRPFL